MIFKKIKGWWKKMEDRYGHLEKGQAFMMGRADSMMLGLQANEKRKRIKEEKRKSKRRGY